VSFKFDCLFTPPLGNFQAGDGRESLARGLGGEVAVGLTWSDGWASCHGPTPKGIEPFAIYSNIFNGLELIQSKDGLPEFKYFQLKYVFVGN
jgi:hypothetical protein